MKKHLFFDDNKLFSKENLVRGYGRAELAATYCDPAVSTDFCTGWVFPIGEGQYRMLYFGHGTEFRGKKLFSAISRNGVDFEPEPLFAVGREKQFPNEVMDLGNGEVAFIYDDPLAASPSERYKLLNTHVAKGELRVIDDLYVSPDLISWTLLPGASWGDGTEPLASVYCNRQAGVNTVIERSFWGVRCAGYKETRDFRSYTEFRHCLNVDSLDEDLSELYGMFAFEYDGSYIGIPHLYRKLESGLHTKFRGGIIDTQLAYSDDGRYWHRSLREPFLSGVNQSLDTRYGLLWVTGMARIGDRVYLYGSASEQDHGEFTPGTGRVLIHRLREDGFVSLRSKDPQKTAVLATREKIWHGGELRVNLRARRATLAVYTTESDDLGCNVLGIASPIPGYTHEDSIPFSGDSTAWIPAFRSGRRLDELAGKTLVLEIRLDDGEIFSLGGDYTDVFNVAAAIYRTGGKASDKRLM